MIGPLKATSRVPTLTTPMAAGVSPVPTQAIQTGQQGSYVYVVKPDRTAESRTVVVERTLNNEAVLTSGVNPDSRSHARRQCCLPASVSEKLSF